MSKKRGPPQTAIELGHLKTPGARTLFLTELISNLLDYSLQNVTQIRIESKVAKVDATELEKKSSSKEKKKAEQELMGVVENVALKGQSLLTSPEYQDLNKKGFYITSITWTAIHKHSPHEIVGNGGISSYRRVNSWSFQFAWFTAWSLNRFFSAVDRRTPNTTACL